MIQERKGDLAAVISGSHCNELVNALRRYQVMFQQYFQVADTTLSDQELHDLADVLSDNLFRLSGTMAFQIKYHKRDLNCAAADIPVITGNDSGDKLRAEPPCKVQFQGIFAVHDDQLPEFAAICRCLFQTGNGLPLQPERLCPCRTHNSSAAVPFQQDTVLAPEKGVVPVNFNNFQTLQDAFTM